jgi:hypothetical protein
MRLASLGVSGCRINLSVVVFIEDSFALQARNNRPQVGRSAGYFFRHGQSPPETTFDPIDRP